MFSIIAKGGIIMVPILICSIISVTVIVERILFWLGHSRKPHTPGALLAIAKTSGPGEMAKEAGRVNHPVARVLAAGASSRRESAGAAMESQAMDEAAGMNKFLPALDTIITLAPLLGLLGTIIGMIRSFDVISLSGLGTPHAVTGGVAEALIATAAGLVVAILTLIPYNYFHAKAEKTTEEMERYATRLELVLKERERL
ncbi:MAG: MotA/TolQ/ExbB proton channel family protein [Deltaproteobacteria bacterium]|nr:MotA/TolQ/ExbB proton channel family protein [Deltaproteobacteria bacterium]